MERLEKSSSSNYTNPPWVFKGSALYQLHLVKADTARALVPKGLRLVEAFGYTLGGFFLASYDDSPAGVFDELVVIAGIVWNPPTSCAWAARVLVNSGEACMHGRKDVGLPSQVARFSKTIRAITRTPKTKIGGLLHMAGVFSSDVEKTCTDVQVSEINGQQAMSICNINFNPIVPEMQSRKWKGPLIKMSLPSFSGLTKYNPHLLKYSCQIECRVKAVQPAKVSGPHEVDNLDNSPCCKTENCSCDSDTKVRRLSMQVMLSKPVIALEFNCLKMMVEAPTIKDDDIRAVSKISNIGS